MMSSEVGSFSPKRRRASSPRRTLETIEPWKPSGIVTKEFTRYGGSKSSAVWPDVPIKVSLPRILWLERPMPE